MKRIIYIVIVLSCLEYKNSHAEPGSAYSFRTFFSLKIPDKSFIPKPSQHNLNALDAGDSEHNPFSKKRKRGKKGIKPILICLTNELHFIIISCETALVYSPQTSYFFRPYLAHGERGPPLARLVS